MAKSAWKVIAPATSSKQEVNRNNARLSTGPRTPEGKESSSANATIHGLTSSRPVLASEDPAEFNDFRHQLELQIAPATFRERVAFQEYVVNLWRLRRCRRIEAGILDACMQSLMEENPGLTADEALARVFIDEKQQKKLRLFLRYQTAIERAVNRALAELKSLQRARGNAETAPQPDAPCLAATAESVTLFSMPASSLPHEAVGFVSKL